MNNITTVIFAAIGIFVGFIIVAFGLSLILSLPVMWLWNWLIPVIFGLKTITWMQAWGLSLLCSFLFKSTSSK